MCIAPHFRRIIGPAPGPAPMSRAQPIRSPRRLSAGGLASVVLAAAAAALAAPAAAQRDVGDPLGHFLGTHGTDGAKRSLQYPVLRLTDDFNNDGLVDVGLWQPQDFVGRTGPVFLYIQRKDGRFAAAGSVVAAADTLLRVAPGEAGSARLLVCAARSADAAVPSGYEVHGSIVTELPRDGLPEACSAANRDSAACREFCGAQAPPPVERLDAARYLKNGTEAWIRR